MQTDQVPSTPVRLNVLRVQAPPGSHHAAPPAPIVGKRSDQLAGLKLYVADQISCASSRVYVKHYEDYIRAHGAAVVPEVRDADIVLIDTCAYSDQKEALSLGLIREHARRGRPDAKVIVCGCLAGINPQLLQQHFQGEFFAPKNERHLAYILNLDEEAARFITPLDPRGRFMGADFRGPTWTYTQAVRAARQLHRLDHAVRLERVPIAAALSRKMLACSQAANPHAYAIAISQGCLGQCSFCVIPMAKGETTSLPLGLVVDKVRDVMAQGVRKVILTSEDSGAYGKDLGTNIVDLLRRLDQIPGELQLHINLFDPRWLRTLGEDLIAVMRSGRVRYLQLPLQSGSDSCLARMRRAYRTEHVLPWIRRMRRELPGLALATQIIAGFPAETDAEHEATRAVLREGLFDLVEVFPFSERKGAAAEQLPGRLPLAVREERARTLRKDWKIGWGRGLLRGG